jgi:hypothetical protein
MRWTLAQVHGQVCHTAILTPAEASVCRPACCIAVQRTYRDGELVVDEQADAGMQRVQWRPNKRAQHKEGAQSRHQIDILRVHT